MNDEYETLELMKKKIQFYFNNLKPVHIELVNGRFYNGFLNHVSYDFVLLQDFIIGETCIFLMEIKLVEAYHEKDKDKSKM